MKLEEMIRPIQIGNVTIENNVFLAPMAGVTDDPFRRLCKEQGAGLVYSEMVSAKGMHYQNRKTNDLLVITKETKPVAVQIFGSDPEIISQIVGMLQETDADIIDINMGCPAPKIVKNGEGSALTKNPALVGKIVKAAVTASPNKPITIKFRRGFAIGEENAVEIAKVAEENGAAAVCVHGRFREQYYSGTADREIIRKVKEAVKIPVIGNGDIVDRESALRMFEETGCDAIAIGRGAEGDPWIFSRILGMTEERPDWRSVRQTILRHMEMLAAQKGEKIAVQEMRKHIAWYIKGIKGAAEIRNKIFQMTEKEKIIEYLLEI